MITASHNPWTDNGFKVKAPTGAAAGADMLAAIEAGDRATTADRSIERRPFADAEAAGLVEWFDPYPGYERSSARTVDLEALRAADVSVLVEPLYGAGSGWIPRLLAGGRIRVTEIHGERNPYFGGVNPEPIRPNVDEALARIAAGGFDLGLLLDGDADRAGAADERGTFLHQLEVTGLLMYYLAEHRGLREPVVVSVNNTSTAATLGRHYGIETHEVPVGFKFIGPRMIETGRDAGRRGVRRVRVRDAPARARRDLRRPAAAGPVPARARARRRGPCPRRWRSSTSSPGRRTTAGSTSTSSGALYDGRQAAAPRRARRRRRRRRSPAAPIDRTQVLSTNDGFKWFLADGSWLLVRASGTEPLVRVYTEAIVARAPRRPRADRRDASSAGG